MAYVVVGSMYVHINMQDTIQLQENKIMWRLLLCGHVQKSTEVTIEFIQLYLYKVKHNGHSLFYNVVLPLQCKIELRKEIIIINIIF